MRRVLRIVAVVCGALLVVVAAGALGLHYWFFGGTYQEVGREGVEVAAPPDPNVAAWRACLDDLERARGVLAAYHELRARLTKQERVGGRLEPVSVLETKQRRSPPSVYFRWVRPYAGREVIYQEGQRGGKFIGSEGGALHGLVPCAILRPDGPFARKFSRHQLSELTVWQLTDRAAQTVRAAADPGLRVTRAPAALRERPATLYEFTHPDPAHGFARLAICIDHASGLPLRWEMYQPPDPPATGEPHLVEYIEFEAPDFTPGLTDVDFDPANPAYGFNLKWVIEEK